MKTPFLLLTICSVFLILVFIKEAKAFFDENEIVQITEIAQQQNIEINKWSMYIKEPIKEYNTKNDIKKIIMEIKKSETGYKWVMHQFKEDHFKIIGERISSNEDINEKIIIIYFPLKDKYNLSITYDIKGSNWDEKKWSEISNLYKSKIEDFTAFYTVEGTTSINEPIEVEAANLLKSFSGETIQTLEEENFVSLSAYTRRWDTKLPLGNNQFMNLNIAYRNSNPSNGSIKVTIGSPIITSEY
ncbi:YwmB family TATA-box binding protein (plasmid) [Alkalihalobacillus hwajinpoensis]|uniref:YwmB family TATA-box binding protein n=1 Tax=Guptibacillus hwajinpoensis TaxID=208199 RepID=UPI00188355CD|nr:YwmB family TATA-box binding protein [Pseudalkalibacillus hwajinpoensis]MBF0706549.1 YwmB family TATA-box binding protein [Pseudalkalibacillus hwajinpoensis]